MYSTPKRKAQLIQKLSKKGRQPDLTFDLEIAKEAGLLLCWLAVSKGFYGTDPCMVLNRHPEAADEAFEIQKHSAGLGMDHHCVIAERCRLWLAQEMVDVCKPVMSQVQLGWEMMSQI